MKKNYSVNIGGRIFNIDEDAYARLMNYLEDLRNYFKQEEGVQEIMADIEMRIGDLLQKRKDEGAIAVTLEAVNTVIAEIGSPEEMGSTDESHEAQTHARQKLYRDPDNKLLGGVASGLAAWLGIHRWLVRGLFILVGCFYFIGVLIYLFFWLIVPLAKTRSQRLEMSGMPLNIDGFSQKRAHNSTMPASQQPLEKLLGTLEDIIKSVFEKFMLLLGFVLLLLKKLSGLALILIILGMVIGFGISSLLRHHYSFDSFLLNELTFFEYFQWLVPSLAVRWQYYFAAAMALVGVGGLFISLGLRLLVSWPPLRWQVMAVFGLLILGGLLLGGYSTYQLQASRHENQMTYQKQTYKTPVNKRLKINLVHKEHDEFLLEMRNLTSQGYFTTSDLVLGKAQLSIRPTEGDSLVLTAMASASGKNNLDALKFAKNFAHKYALADSVLSFDERYTLYFDDGYHDHELNYILSVPSGIKIWLEGESWNTIPWNDFKDHEHDKGWFLMTKEGMEYIPEKVVNDSIPN
jgi:phage shock protein PspC (stress-responsive transcriptional regulator)